MSVKKIALCSILIAFAIIISLVEKLIPMDIVLPGLKLGLANIVTLYAILKIGKKEAFVIFLIRVILSATISGRISSLSFSFLGALFSYIIMCILSRFVGKGISVIGLSIAGSAGHNTGQIIAGIILIGNTSILLYLPYLLIMSIPVGFLTGELITAFFKKTQKGLS